MGGSRHSASHPEAPFPPDSPVSCSNSTGMAEGELAGAAGNSASTPKSLVSPIVCSKFLGIAGGDDDALPCLQVSGGSWYVFGSAHTAASGAIVELSWPITGSRGVTLSRCALLLPRFSSLWRFPRWPLMSLPATADGGGKLSWRLRQHTMARQSVERVGRKCLAQRLGTKWLEGPSECCT